MGDQGSRICTNILNLYFPTELYNLALISGVKINQKAFEKVKIFLKKQRCGGLLLK
jgi:hypothetical protein